MFKNNVAIYSFNINSQAMLHLKILDLQYYWNHFFVFCSHLYISCWYIQYNKMFKNNSNTQVILYRICRRSRHLLLCIADVVKRIEFAVRSVDAGAVRWFVLQTVSERRERRLFFFSVLHFIDFFCLKELFYVHVHLSPVEKVVL